MSDHVRVKVHSHVDAVPQRNETQRIGARHRSNRTHWMSWGCSHWMRCVSCVAAS